jgi:cytochrome c biogenesis protein
LELKTDRRWLATAVELISSMRFAISLLAIIAIASVIGTVMKQGEPMNNYVNQFGPFWFEIFRKLGLYAVYSTWWFLLIMGVLVLSTSLCIVRNAPKMIKDARSWRENVREQSLHNFHHKLEWRTAAPIAGLAQRLQERIAASGYKVKLVNKGEATLISAKQGAASKWGYIFAHSAIVIICIGGLLDSDLPIRFQEWAFGKMPFVGNGIIAQIPAQNRLSINNPSFRGNTFIPEGGSSSTAIIQQADGVLVQDLPFTIRLQKFVIDFYSTGMPKLFASHVIVTDHESGKQFNAVIKVNEPLIYKGMAVYQSSFEDGGSKLKLTAYPLTDGRQKPFDITGEVGGSTPLDKAPGGYTVEWSGFKVFNVENMARSGQDVRAVNFGKALDQHLGAAAKADRAKEFTNLGPSVQYKLRDKTGQAREFHNYMAPITIDGNSFFLAGMRESPDDPFRYLRIPADDKLSIDEWMRLRTALMNPELRALAAQHYAQRALPETDEGTVKLRQQLQASTTLGLSIFAGNGGPEAGYVAVSHFLEKMPADQQKKGAEIFMKILNGSLWDLWQLARQKDGLPAMQANEQNARFMQLAVDALSDSFAYGAPVFLQLKDFTEIKASVLQVTRSPGKKIVYLGCLLLVLGVFAMLYIRERRVWVWLKSDGSGGTHALMAMSAQRKTMDFENEFEQLKTRLSKDGAS